MGFTLQRCRHVKVCDTFRFGLYNQWEVATLYRTDVAGGPGDRSSIPCKGKDFHS